MAQFLLQARRFINRADSIRPAITEDGVEPTMGTLVLAENVDVDNYGLLTMRKGTSQVLAAATHSFFSHPEDDSVAYYMVGDELYKLNDDYTGTAVATMGTTSELQYVVCGTEIVCTNGVDIGFLNGTTFDSFSQSPTQFEEQMPAGQFIVYDEFDNVLLVVENNIIHRSKPYNPQVIDKRFSDFPTIGDIVSVGVVEDGLYIGTTTGVGYAKREGEDDFTYSDISTTPPIRGCFYNGFEYSDKGRVKVAAWVSVDGLCVGQRGGEVKNVSYPTTAIDGGASGKLFYREQNGTFQYVIVIRNELDGYEYVPPTIPVNSRNV